MKPPVRNQGVCTVEKDGTVFIVCTPDGGVQGAPTKAAAEKICKKWFEKHASGSHVNVGQIVWED